jgi:hypothetical protein
MSGVERITAERQRQFEKGLGDAHDDDNNELGELADAAACYLLIETFVPRKNDNIFEKRLKYIRRIWPWSSDEWNPGTTRIRQLEKAGALIAAEIDRLLRAEEGEES